MGILARKFSIALVFFSLFSFFFPFLFRENASPKNRKPIHVTILDSRDKMTLTIEGGLMLLINFAAFTGNLLMCFVLYKKPRFHTTANTSILSLTICHMFTSCLVMPFTAGSLLAGEWPFGQILCDIQGFVFLALTWVSLQLLTIMAACRCFKVTQLVFHNKWFSLNRSIAIIMIIWVLDVAVLIFSTIPAGGTTFPFSPKRSMPCTRTLSRENQTVNIFNTVITLVLNITLLIISIVALCAIRRHDATIWERRRITLIHLRIAAEERRTNKVLLALTTEVLLIWMPIVIIKLVEFPVQPPVMAIPRQVHLASTFLWFAVPVLHPVTYGALYRPSSREVLRVVPSKRLGQNKVHAEHSI